MKKRTKSAKKKSAKPRRKPIMRHSREGVRSSKKAKAKAKPKAKPKAAKSKPKATPRPKPKAKAKSKARAVASPKASRASKPSKRRAPVRARGPRVNRTDGAFRDAPWKTRGLGAEAGGQSGDTEGLSRSESADSESVEELIEEGQAFEAGVVSGVENAPDADKGGVRTRQVNEDDVPEEYFDER